MSLNPNPGAAPSVFTADAVSFSYAWPSQNSAKGKQALAAGLVPIVALFRNKATGKTHSIKLHLKHNGHAFTPDLNALDQTALNKLKDLTSQFFSSHVALLENLQGNQVNGENIRFGFTKDHTFFYFKGEKATHQGETPVSPDMQKVLLQIPDLLSRYTLNPADLDRALQTENARLRAQNSNLSEQLAAKALIENQLEASKAVLLQAQEQVTALQEENARLKEDNEELTQENTGLHRLIDTHTQQLKERNTEIEDLKKKLRAADEEIRKLSNKNERLQNESRVAGDTSVELARLNAQLQTATHEKKGIKARLKDAEAEKQKLEAAITSVIPLIKKHLNSDKEFGVGLSENLQNLVAELIINNTDNRSKNTKLQSEIDRLTKELQSLETASNEKYRKYKNKKSELESKIKDIEGQLEELKNRKDTQEAFIRHQNENERLAAQVENLNNKITEKDGEIEELKRDLEKAKKSKAKGAGDKVKELENRLTSTQSQVKELAELLNKAEDSKKESDQKINDLQEKLGQLGLGALAVVYALHEQLRSAEQEKHALNQKLQNLDLDKSSYVAELGQRSAYLGNIESQLGALATLLDKTKSKHTKEHEELKGLIESLLDALRQASRGAAAQHLSSEEDSESDLVPSDNDELLGNLQALLKTFLDKDPSADDVESKKTGDIVSEFRALLEKLHRKIDIQAAIINQYESYIQDLEDEKSKAIEKINNLNKEIENLKKEFQSNIFGKQDEQLDTLSSLDSLADDSQIDELQQTISQLLIDGIDSDSLFENKIETLQAGLEAAKQENQKLQRLIKQLQQENDWWKKEYLSLFNQYLYADDKIQLSLLNKANEELKSKLTNANRQHQKGITALREHSKLLFKENQRLQDLINNKEGTLAERSEELTLKDLQLDELKKKDSATKTLNEGLERIRTVLGELTAEKTELRNNIEKLNREYKGALENLNKELNAKFAEDLKREYEDLRKKYNDSLNQVDAERRDLSAELSRLRELQTELYELRGRYNSLADGLGNDDDLKKLKSEKSELQEALKNAIDDLVFTDKMLGAFIDEFLEINSKSQKDATIIEKLINENGDWRKKHDELLEKLKLHEEQSKTIKEREDFISDLKDKIGSLTASLSILDENTNELESVKEVNRVLSALLNSLHLQIKEIQSDLSESKKDFDILMRGIHEQSAAWNRIKNSLELEIVELRSKLDSEKSAKDNGDATAKARITDLESAVKELEIYSEFYKKALERVENLASERRTNYLDLYKQFESSVEESLKNSDELEQKIIEINYLKKKCQELEEIKEKFQNTLGKLDDFVSNYEKRFNELKLSVDGRIGNSNTRLASLEQQLESLRQNNQELQQEIFNKDSLLLEKERACNSLEQRVAELELQLTDLQRQLDIAGQEGEQKGTEYTDLETQYNNLAREKDELTNKLAKANLEIDGLKEALNAYKDELEENEIKSNYLEKRCLDLFRESNKAKQNLTRSKKIIGKLTNDYDRSVKEHLLGYELIINNLSELTTKIVELEIELKSTLSKLAENETALKEKDERCRKLVEQKERLEAELQLAKSLSGELSKINTELQEITKEAKTVEDERNMLITENAELKSGLEQKNRELESANVELTGLREAKIVLEKNANELEQKLANARLQLEIAEESLEKLRIDVEDNDKRNHDLSQTNQKLINDLEQKNKELELEKLHNAQKISKITANIESLENELNLVKQENTRLLDELSTARSLLAENQDTIKMKDDQYNELKKQKERLEAILKDANEKLQSGPVSVELGNIKLGLDEIADSILTVEAAKNKLENENSELNKTIEILENKLAETDKKLSSTNERLSGEIKKLEADLQKLQESSLLREQAFLDAKKDFIDSLKKAAEENVRLVRELELVKSKLSDYYELIASFSDQSQELVTEQHKNDELNKKNAELEKELIEAKRQLERLKKRFDGSVTKEEYTQYESDTNKTIKYLSERIAELMEELTAYTDNLNESNSRVKELNKKNEELEDRIKQLQNIRPSQGMTGEGAGISSEQASYNELKEKYNALSIELGATKKSLEELINKHSILQDTYNELLNANSDDALDENKKNSITLKNRLIRTMLAERASMMLETVYSGLEDIKSKEYTSHDSTAKLALLYNVTEIIDKILDRNRIAEDVRAESNIEIEKIKDELLKRSDEIKAKEEEIKKLRDLINSIKSKPDEKDSRPEEYKDKGSFSSDEIDAIIKLEKQVAELTEEKNKLSERAVLLVEEYQKNIFTLEEEKKAISQELIRLKSAKSNSLDDADELGRLRKEFAKTVKSQVEAKEIEIRNEYKMKVKGLELEIEGLEDINTDLNIKLTNAKRDGKQELVDAKETIILRDSEIERLKAELQTAKISDILKDKIEKLEDEKSELERKIKDGDNIFVKQQEEAASKIQLLTEENAALNEKIKELESQRAQPVKSPQPSTVHVQESQDLDGINKKLIIYARVLKEVYEDSDDLTSKIASATSNEDISNLFQEKKTKLGFLSRSGSFRNKPTTKDDADLIKRKQEKLGSYEARIKSLSGNKYILENLASTEYESHIEKMKAEAEAMKYYFGASNQVADMINEKDIEHKKQLRNALGYKEKFAINLEFIKKFIKVKYNTDLPLKRITSDVVIYCYENKKERNDVEEIIEKVVATYKREMHLLNEIAGLEYNLTLVYGIADWKLEALKLEIDGNTIQSIIDAKDDEIISINRAAADFSVIVNNYKEALRCLLKKSEAYKDKDKEALDDIINAIMEDTAQAMMANE